MSQIKAFTSLVPPSKFVARSPEPVLLRGRASTWPALSRWSFDYLKTISGDRMVRLVQGNREQGQTRFTQMPMAEYIELIAQRKHSDQKLYLKEFDLFHEFPFLLKDCVYEDFFPWYVRPGKFAWIGQQGAETGLHYDIFDNFLIQVVGVKKLLLFSPSAIPRFYQSDKFDYGARDSLFNANHPDYERFPLLKEVRPLVLEFCPGDVLYIPKGWWHQVISIDATISIANFMVSIRDRIGTEVLENIRSILHQKGLYKKGNCTCH